jgi:mannan endo-1,4-beta-mannosidase
MTYDRLVNFHRLNNLIWVFGANEVRNSVAPYADFFPGHDVVDVLATDVYGGGFAKPDYDALLELAAGKPIGLGEVGPVPPLEKLREQPRWTFYVVWGELYSGGGGGGRPDFDAIRQTFNSDEVLNWEELPWVNVKRPTVHYPVLK